MLKVLLLIILSPLAIFCGILSIAIVYAVLKKIIELTVESAKAITDFINNRDDKQC